MYWGIPWKVFEILVLKMIHSCRFLYVSLISDITNSIFRPLYYTWEFHWSHNTWLRLVSSHFERVKISKTSVSIVFSIYSIYIPAVYNLSILEAWASAAPPIIWWQRTKSSSIYAHTYVSSTSNLMCFLMCVLLCFILGIDWVIELCCYRDLTLEKNNLWKIF